MKELRVNENCNGCGFCVVSAPNYFVELENGNAKVKKTMIEKFDEDQVTNAIRNCPENAIVITEKENFSGNRKDFIQYIVNKIQKFNNEFKIEKVTTEGYEFWNSDYGIYFGIRDEWPPAYSSESAARSAARERFREKCYSEQAYRPKIKEIFVNYKVNKLKPYYTDPSKEDSAYYEIVQKVNSFLQNIESEMKTYNINVDSEWSSYTYPVDEYTYYNLKHFDDRSMSSGIIDKLKSRGSYTTLDWYMDHNVKISSMIVDRKETLFGRYRDIYKYYFTGLSDAADEYGKDLSSAISRQSSEITNEVVKDINKQLESLEEHIHKELEKKIQEFRDFASRSSESSREFAIHQSIDERNNDFIKSSDVMSREKVTSREFVITKEMEERREYGIPLRKGHTSGGAFFAEELEEVNTEISDFCNFVCSPEWHQKDMFVKHIVNGSDHNYVEFLQDYFYRKYKGYITPYIELPLDNPKRFDLYNQTALESGHPEYMIDGNGNPLNLKIVKV